jgi:hypothetical protein
LRIPSDALLAKSAKEVFIYFKRIFTPDPRIIPLFSGIFILGTTIFPPNTRIIDRIV